MTKNLLQKLKNKAKGKSNIGKIHYIDYYSNISDNVQKFYKSYLKYNSNAYVYAIIYFENLVLLEYTNSNIVSSKLVTELTKLINKIIKGESLLLRTTYNTFILVFGNQSTSTELIDKKQLKAKLTAHEKLEKIIVSLNKAYSKDYGLISVKQTIKVGYTVSAKISNLRDVMQKARIAIQKAQREENPLSVVCFSQNDGKAHSFMNDIKLTREFQNTFKKGLLKLILEPIFDINNNVINYYEALLRIKSTNGEFISAKPYLRAAEKLGAISKIDIVVLEMAVNILKEQKDINLSVNMSRLSAKDADWHNKLFELLNNKLEIAKRLSIEITETSFGEEEDLRGIMSLIKTLGCKVGLDDFGAGHTSLMQLKNLPLDFVKVDGDLVLSAMNDRVSHAIIESIINVCKAIDVKVVIEYVESATIAEKFRNMHVDYLQGRYFW